MTVQEQNTGNLIARVFVENSSAIPDAARARALRLLADITSQPESEQLLIAAAAIDQSAEAQMQLLELLSQP